MEINWGDVRPNCEVASMCMEAGKQNLPTLELKILMADISLGFLNDYRFIPDPARPIVLTKFESDKRSHDWEQKTSQEKAIIYEKILKRDDVKEYYDTRSKIAGILFSNADALERMIETFLEWEEVEKARKCWDVYSTYPDAIYINSKDIIWKKKRSWDSPRR